MYLDVLLSDFGTESHVCQSTGQWADRTKCTNRSTESKGARISLELVKQTSFSDELMELGIRKI